MSSKHKKIGKFKKIFTIMSHNADCGCANPNPTQVSVPKPISQAQKPSPPPPPPPPTIRRHSSSTGQSSYVDDEEDYSSSTASATVGSTSSQFSRSPNDDDGGGGGGGKIGPHFRGSVAVVKESDDPYRDFRQSMIQMMAARDMWSEEGLEELLKCFLRLNSPFHHEIIIQAFTEIRHGGGGRRPQYF